ncbi:DUF3302 domain-containing protein [Microbaculum marinisediminis]|uniref:DUF3302 domain-containing protein n=1 Tax=Microbaculum marinisediminis TaxID=2931392 RepID=UPI0021BF18C9|nr:DUF3302 domain-containing protein [Microbaculum sp. A6E488]
MSGLDIFAWIVLGVLLIAALVIWFVLAMLPGRIARARQHPQADAVNVAGWLGALFGGIFWPLALVWAFYKSEAAQVGGVPEADNTAVAKPPASKTSTGKTAAAKTPAGKAPAGKPAAEKTSAGKPSAGKTTARKKAAGKPPTGKTAEADQ